MSRFESKRELDVDPVWPSPSLDISSSPCPSSARIPGQDLLLNLSHRARSGFHQMSEIEQVSEPDKQFPSSTNGTDSTQTPLQPQELLSAAEDAQPLVNGTPASPPSAQSTPAAAPPPIKRFSSANINKKFLQKTTSTLNSNSALSNANSSSPGPAPTKAATTTGQPLQISM